MTVLWLILLCIGSYLLGSVSPSLLLSRFAWGIDIRQYGSGNAGTTNMLRVMGWKYGVATFAIDFLKGLVPALVGLWVGIPMAPYCMGIAAALGHAFPVFSHFKGGKCVVTAAGALVTLQPLLALACLALGVLICFITRIVSLGSLSGYLLGLVFSFFIPSIPIAFSLMLLALTVLVFWRHRENIVRILHGEEKKLVVGSGKKPPKS